VGKEHLNLLSELHRNLVLFGFGQIPSDLTRIFVLLAGDLARIETDYSSSVDTLTIRKIYSIF